MNKENKYTIFITYLNYIFSIFIRYYWESLLFLSLVFFSNIPIHAQAYYNFDSLVQNSPEFKSYAKQIEDTFNFFDDEDILNVTLISDFRNLIKNKYKDEYQNAVLKFSLNDTVTITRNIEIKPRGDTRKKTCLFPPLKIKFSKKDIFFKQLNEFDKLKLVVDCKKGDLYDQYLLMEYYAYKVQNVITDFSLKVRLLSINYIDVNDKMKESTQYGFLIESIDQLSKRQNVMEVEVENLKDDYTDHKSLADTYLFQYLIGNTDWSIPGLHNIYLVKSLNPNISAPVAIAYDFDYAGIINTNYAIPDPHLGTRTVRERVYRGVCIPEIEIKNAAKGIISKKEKIYDIYRNDKLLNKFNKQNTIEYLDDFFEIMENDNLLKKNIIDSCRE